jgi:NADH-quinone oxidoreductase subunit I
VVGEDGKKKRAIDKHIYHLGMCTFCNLCIRACPTGAIEMAQTFEHTVWDRSELTKVLNQPGSKIMEGVKE